MSNTWWLAFHSVAFTYAVSQSGASFTVPPTAPAAVPTTVPAAVPAAAVPAAVPAVAAAPTTAAVPAAVLAAAAVPAAAAAPTTALPTAPLAPAVSTAVAVPAQAISLPTGPVSAGAVSTAVPTKLPLENHSPSSSSLLLVAVAVVLAGAASVKIFLNTGAGGCCVRRELEQKVNGWNGLEQDVILDIWDVTSQLAYTLIYSSCVATTKRSYFIVANISACILEVLVSGCAIYIADKKAIEDAKEAYHALEGQAVPAGSVVQRKYDKILQDKSTGFLLFTGAWDAAMSILVANYFDPLFDAQGCSSFATAFKMITIGASVVNLIFMKMGSLIVMYACPRAPPAKKAPPKQKHHPGDRWPPRRPSR